MDFGDLRSAVHAENRNKKDILAALAIISANRIHHALQYCIDNGFRDLVTQWINDLNTASTNPLDIFGSSRLTGMYKRPGVAVDLMGVSVNSNTINQWCLDHVRKPAYDNLWRPWVDGLSRVPANVEEMDLDLSEVLINYRRHVLGKIDNPITCAQYSEIARKIIKPPMSYEQASFSVRAVCAKDVMVACNHFRRSKATMWLASNAPGQVSRDEYWQYRHKLSEKQGQSLHNYLIKHATIKIK